MWPHVVSFLVTEFLRCYPNWKRRRVGTVFSGSLIKNLIKVGKLANQGAMYILHIYCTLSCFPVLPLSPPVL